MQVYCSGYMVSPPHLCLIPSILCGGACSRLWPAARELQPKPFIHLADGQSLLKKAYQRGAQLFGLSHRITPTMREIFFKTKDAFPSFNAIKASTSYILGSAGHKHRLTNPGTTPCVIIEVQGGEYVNEDDIVRFEDAYGRIE